jgi:hypothetical protein
VERLANTRDPGAALSLLLVMTCRRTSLTPAAKAGAGLKMLGQENTTRDTISGGSPPFKH